MASSSANLPQASRAAHCARWILLLEITAAASRAQVPAMQRNRRNSDCPCAREGYVSGWTCEAQVHPLMD